MRSNTQIVMGIRNVGDAADNGEIHSGTLKECLMWGIEKIGSISMARRIVLVIGRNEDEVNVGLDLKRGNARITVDMQSMLDKLMDGVDGESTEIRPAGWKDPEDDWIQP